MLKSIYQYVTIIIVSFLLSNTSIAQCSGVCSPNLYEEFNYPVNSDIHNAVGGSGWSGAWVKRSLTTNIFKIRSGSLGFSSLKTFNNKLSDTATTYSGVARFINVSNSPGAPFAGFISSSNRIGKPNTTLYLSVLMKKNSTDKDMFSAVYLARLDNATSLGVPDETAGQGTFGIGYFGDSSIIGGKKFWSLKIENKTFKSSDSVAIGKTVLLVLKMEFLDSTTKYSLYVNPTSIGNAGEPATASVTATVSKIMEFRSLAINGNHKCGDGDVDEIRMATTYQCATPDATTAYNLLPIASFTNNISSGTAPFAISFNANASSDPDGNIVNYNWACSDGTIATGATPTIVFNNQGAIIVTLTVTDNCGSVSSTSTTVLVNSSKGYFSCFATPKLSKFGNCDSTTGGGEIIFTGGTSYSLFNKKMNAVTNQSSGTFSNLNAGFYRIAVAGNLGCKDTFNLQVPISHECAGQARGNLMKMGINIEGLSYYNQCATFKNYMLTSSEFFSGNVSNVGAFNTNLMNQIPVDSNGYPLQVPYTPSGNVPQKVRTMLSSTNRHLPQGNYVLLYDGIGTFSFAGATVVSSAPNRIVYNVTGTGNVWLDILTSSSTDYVKNIRLLRLADESTYLTQPFADKLLRAICNFSCIRFMDLQCTNSNTNTTWSGRTIPTFHSQANNATLNKGIAYEHICQLANFTGKDIWICVPHLADDNYITEMAKLFKSKLNPQIKVFLEFSNEVWNYAFVQTTAVNNAGPQNISTPRRYALRCANMFNLWKQVWGNDFNRITRVVGTQAANNTIGQEAMAELRDNFDMLAPALYFNYTFDANCYANLKSLGTAATTHDILSCAKNDFLTTWASVAQNNKNAWMYGKGIVHYEFGQGLTSGGFVESFQDSTYAAQLTSEMVALYQQTIDSLKHWNTDQINPFALTGPRKSKYGSWGHLEYIDQDTTTEPAPKYSVLLRNINPAVQGTCLYPGVPITSVANANGNISPAGITTVGLNANQTYTITPNAGFCIQDVLVDGNSVGAVSSFTFSNVVTTHTISVSYIAQVTPSISIVTSANNVCNSTSITCTANPVNRGSSPIYQWKLNGNNVGANTTTFTTSSLQNNDVVSCVMTADNSCQTTATATSNSIIATIKSATTSTSNIAICASALPFSWNGNSFSNAGVFVVHLTNSKGCDSAATLVLTILSASSSITNASTCTNQLPFIWNGNSFNNSGTFVVHLINSKGCDSAATLVLMVLSTSSTNATINVCSNQLPYTWRGLVFNAAGTQTAHLTNSVGCDSAVILTVNVGGAVTPSVGISTASSIVCSANNVTFTANGINGGISPIYNWKRNGNNLGSGSSITFFAGTVLTGDVISCELTANNECQTTAIAISNTIQMTVKQSPVIGTSTISLPTLCKVGATTNAYNSNTNGGGVWSSDNTAIASVLTVSGATGIVTAIGNGTTALNYTKTASNGCQLTASSIVMVNQIAIPNAITGSNSVCINKTIQLSTTSVGGVWSTTSSSIASVNASGIVTGNGAGVSVIKYTLTSGQCSASASYNITVNPTPTVPSIQYAAGTSNPQTGAGGTFCVGKAFKVVGTSTISPIVSGLAGVWISNNPGVLSITAAGSGDNRDTGLVNLLSSGSATLTYAVTSLAGCENSRSVNASVVSTCFARGVNVSSSEKVVSSSEFTMYPNPAKTFISLNVSTLMGSGSIVITDLYGKQVKTQPLSMGNNTIDIAHLSKGFYMVSIITNDGKTTKKLVVE